MAEKEFALLHLIDKCMRCRGCQVACQRSRGLTTIIGNGETIQTDDVNAIKAQKANDNPPFVRYACWHCKGAPCTYSCPLNAVKTVQKGQTIAGGNGRAAGAVYVDEAICNPNDPACVAKGRPCSIRCHRGGYPKVATVTDPGPGLHSYKCNMCYDKPNGPACAITCPGGALKWAPINVADVDADHPQTIQQLITAAGCTYKAGDGHMFWASKKPFTAPTTDPFIEDHISPMFGSLAKGPFARALVLPTILFGGAYALYKRRFELDEEANNADTV